jgi:hypothetical protein
MPQALRFSLYRNMISLNYLPSDDFEFKVADTQEELEAAFRILHDAYVGSNFMEPQDNGMRITPYHALPSTSTLIGKYKGQVIATVSIVRKSSYGFPLEDLFDVSEYEKCGTRLAEISALAIHKDYRGNKGDVLWPLLKYMYEYCTNYFGIDFLAIAVNPNRVEFYQALLFFELLDEGAIYKYDFVKGVEAVGGVLDLRNAYDIFASMYLRKSPSKNLFMYFTQVSFDIFKFPDRTYHKISDPVLTPKMLKYFFREKSAIFETLEPEKLNKIAAQFSLTEYNSVLQCQEQDVYRVIRAERRFDVQCKGKIVIPKSKRIVLMDILDVSLSGFNALLDSTIRFGHIYYISIVVGEFEVAEIRAYPVWNAKDNVFGFSIEDSSNIWKAFTANLENLHSDSKIIANK